MGRKFHEVEIKIMVLAVMFPPGWYSISQNTKQGLCHDTCGTKLDCIIEFLTQTAVRDIYTAPSRFERLPSDGEME